MIDLLQRSDGATIPTLIEATGWLPHTTRAALTGLRKRGYAVVRERVDGGDSVYRIAGARLRMAEIAPSSNPKRPRAATASLSRRRTKRRDRHGSQASQLRTGGEAAGEDSAGGFAAARCFSALDRGGSRGLTISMGCAANGAPIWAASLLPISRGGC